MKIAHICHLSSSSGVSALPTNLNNELNKSENYISNYYHNDTPQDKKNFTFIENSKILNQSIFDIYLKYKAEGVANYCFFYEGIENNQILKIFDDYDVIHLHWVNYFLNLENLVQLFKKKPIIITVHDQHLLFGGCHWRNNCQNYKANCVNCPQLDEKINKIANYNFLKKKELFDNSNVTFIHQNEESFKIGLSIYSKNIHKLIDCSTDIANFNIIDDKSKLKKKYGIEKEKKIILSLCGYDSYTKGSWQVKELEKYIDPKTILILAGSGFNNISSIKNRIYNLGHINDKVKINELYNIADVCFSLSREEGVPGITCESLSAGTPFVGFEDVGNLNRMIINGKNGFLIKKYSIKQFAEKLNEKFLSQKEIRNDFLNRIENNFLKNYKQAYEKIILSVKEYKNIELKNDIQINFKKIIDQQIEKNNKLNLSSFSFLIYFIKNFKEGSKLIIRYFYNRLRKRNFYLFIWRNIFNTKIRNLVKRYIKKIF